MIDDTDNPAGSSRRTRRDAALLLMAAVSLALAPALAAAPKPPLAKGPPSPHKDLIAAAKNCGKVGDVCLKHCIRLTKAGDKSIAKCMETVRAMLPVCAAMAQLASLDAKRVKELAAVCVAVCGDCEDECRKHEFHHRECKACAESCAAMVKEARKLLTPA